MGGNSRTIPCDQYVMQPQITGTARRCAVSILAAVCLVLLGAGPASAHVEASAEGAQAGTGPVTVAFVVEAESTTTGIVSVKAQLPGEIAPESVSLASGPSGWSLAPTSDGYEIGGADIGAGVDLQFAVTIAQLPPDVTELPFKTLVRYSGGREVAWIELPTEVNPEPEFPAPTITVAPAPPTSAAATTSPSVTPSDPATTSATADAERAAQPSDASDPATRSGIVAVGILVLAAVGGGLWFWRSRAGRRQ